MLGRRRRRRPSIKPTWGQRLVCAGDVFCYNIRMCYVGSLGGQIIINVWNDTHAVIIIIVSMLFPYAAHYVYLQPSTLFYCVDDFGFCDV